MKLYKTCYTTYIDESSIRTALKKSIEQSKATRQANKAAKEFDFQSMCFFCENKKHPRDKDIHFIENVDTVKGIIEALEKRKNLNDDEASLLKRVNVLKNKLKTVKAMYHGVCIKKFHNYRICSILGRPRSEDMTNVLSFIFDYILNHTEECQFSV